MDGLWYIGKIAELLSEENIIVEIYKPAGNEGVKTGYSLKSKYENKL
jgi:hypothetical protein